jgi:hypothetical protein
MPGIIMKKIVLSFFVFTFTFTVSFSQKVSGRPQFQQGQIIGITVELKTTVSQEAGGQAGSVWNP